MTDASFSAETWSDLGQVYRTRIDGPSAAIGLEVLSARSSLIFGDEPGDESGPPDERLNQLARELGLALAQRPAVDDLPYNGAGLLVRDLILEAHPSAAEYGPFVAWSRAPGRRRYEALADELWPAFGYRLTDLNALDRAAMWPEDIASVRPLDGEARLLWRVLHEPCIPVEGSPPQGTALSQVVQAAAESSGSLAVGIMLGGPTPLGVVLAGATLIFIKVCTEVGDGLSERAKQAILGFGADEKPKKSTKKDAKKKSKKTK